LLTEPLLAQKISISASQKMSNRTPHFDILGKCNLGVFIHKYGDNKNTVEAYNDRMELKWVKELPLPSNECRVMQLTLYPKELAYFYLKPTDDKRSILFYKAVTADLSSNLQRNAIDTFSKPPKKISNQLNVKEAANLTYFMVTKKKEEKNDNLKNAEVTIVNKDGDINQHHTLNIGQSAAFQFLKWGGIDNKGYAHLAVKKDFKERKRDGRQDYYMIHRMPPDSSSSQTIKIRFENPVFEEPKFQFDQANYRLTAAAFYKANKDADPAKGYMFWVYNFAKDKTVLEKYHPFKANMVYRITGKDTAKHDNVLYTFKIRDFINRYDGGAILVAESQFNNTEDVDQQQTNMPSASPTFRSVKIHYYNDIIVFSTNPDGGRDWHSILKKKQVSENDDGFYSSYSKLLTGSKLRFIYNEEIFKKTNINEYQVTPTGEVNRKSLFNSGNQNIMLMPKLAKQISSNEVIIPSYKKNKVSFLKFTY